MKNNYYKLFSALTLLIAVGVVFSSSCKKNKDCKATITVLHSSGLPYVSATVTMSPTQPTGPQGQTNLATQIQTGVTDGSGSVSFTFKLPAILNASVADTSASASFPIVTGLVKLEESKTVEKKLTVN